MFRRKDNVFECPVEPFLVQKGLQGKRLGVLDSFIDFGNTGYGWLLNVNAVFISCQERISPDKVKVTLRNVMKRHPNLRMKITLGESQSKRYLTFFETPPEPNLDVLETDDWKAVFHDQLSTGFKGDDLPWRVKMLNPSQNASGRWRHGFVFCFNHAPVDGVSIIAGILTDFFHYLEDAVVGKDSQVESHALLPCRDIIFPQINPGFFDRVIFKLKSLFQREPFTTDSVARKLIDAIKPVGPVTPASKVLPIDLSAEETAKIVQKCRDNGIKVNGYASAVAAIATAKLIWEKTDISASEKLKLHLGFLVNMRSLAKPKIPQDQVGYINSIITHDPEISGDVTNKETFWNLAKWYHHSVWDAVANEEHLQAAKFINTVMGGYSGYWNEVFDELGKAETPTYTYYMTNRGSFQIQPQYPEESSACTFEGNYWGSSEHMINMSAFVHSLQSVNGHMMWTLTYYAHTCTDEIAQKYIDDIKDMLVTFIQ